MAVGNTIYGTTTKNVVSNELAATKYSLFVTGPTDQPPFLGFF